MGMKSLACCAQSFGYGPAAKLILLAHGLRERGFGLTYLGTGIALELAARNSVFDDVIETSVDDSNARSIIRDCSGLLSVMDREYSALALELSRPVYVVDSLAWLREQIPDPFTRARRYWVQRFAELDRVSAALPSNAVVVGPIVGNGRMPLVRRENLIVNLGGGESPHGGLADNPAYVDFVVSGIVESGIPAMSRFSGGIILVAGSRCTEYLRRRYSGIGIEFRSVSHHEAQSLFGSASCVMTAPGMTTSLECFQLGVPTFFLPPQNYSQWRILQSFRRSGLAPSSFHWDDLELDGPSPEEASETERTPMIGHIIQRSTKTPRAARLFVERLQGSLAVSEKELSRKQMAYFAGLGDNGAEQIVNDLVEMY